MQGFTSPLNVLVPAFVYRWWPEWDYWGPLWAFRFFGLCVLTGGFGYFLRKAEFDGGARWLFLTLVALQMKTVAFAMNGQEAALWIGFLAPALWCAARGHGAFWLPAGLCWAGLMWTRPDNPVYIAALATGGLLFCPEARKSQWRGVAKAALVTTLLYGPWFVWTWSYYGNPVPHTILAKFGSTPAAVDPAAWVTRFADSWLMAVGRPFEPVYAEAGGWPAWLFLLTRSLGLWCALRWLWAGAGVLRRMSGWIYFCGTLYLANVGTVGAMYPWYFPPLGLAGAVVLALDLHEMGQRCATRKVAKWGARVGTGALLAGFAWVALFAFEQQRVRQVLIEHGVREQVGRWLKANVQPGERVFLEPLGYIGYFSEARMQDFPGLVSPAVVQARRTYGNTYIAVIDALQPEWVVLRGGELLALEKIEAFRNTYEPVHRVRARDGISGYADFPGSKFIFADGLFVVMRRKSP